MLQTAVDAAGGPREFCDRSPVKLENSNVYATLDGRLKPGGRIAAAVGIRRVTIEAYVALDAEYEPPEGYEIIPDRINIGGRGAKTRRDVLKIKPQKEPVSWPPRN